MLEIIDHHQIFHFFEEISKIPRGSGYNEKISDYLMDFAGRRHLECFRDDALNVVIRKDGVKGYEDLPPVILQGHMDMVCEKEVGVEHDFQEDGIDLMVEDGFVKAKGTTLGADNGIAVAYALAILDATYFKHPPLEVVLTSDEEIGLLGATRLDASRLQGKYLINLDSEEEGVLLASCAGGLTISCQYPFTREEVRGERVNISIHGLTGGHSGMEIHKNRINAIRLMGRLLLELDEGGIHLEDMWGGSKDNAIPREAECRLVVAGDAGGFVRRMEEVASSIQGELEKREPALRIDVKRMGEGTYTPLTKQGFQTVLFHLLSVPNGVQVMSGHITGLVESSLNLGVMRMEGNLARFTHSIRSSQAGYKRFLGNQVRYLVSGMGGTHEERGEYPEWEFKEASKLRDMACLAYETLYHKKLKVEAVHAGLECGVFAKAKPGIDMISIGPDVFDVHTPNERLDVASTIRTFDFLLRILEEFGKQKADEKGMEEFKRVGRKLIHKGNIVSFYKDEMRTPNGNVVDWDFLDHKGAAAVVPVDEDGNILMVRQYRGAIDQYTLEVPAGGKDEGEDMMACAVRELEEETGYRAGKIERLIDLYSVPAYCNETIAVFYATELVATRQNLDTDEFVNVERYRMEELVEMILDGKINESKTVAALLAYRCKFSR